MNFSIELGPLDRSQAERIRTWRNDPAIWRWTRQSDFISDVDQALWFDRQSADPTIRMYALQTRLDADTPRMIGVCGLTSIDFLNRRAEFSLYVAPEYQGKGFGSRGLQLLLRHAFMNLGLRQVWGETFDKNPAARIFERLGFKKDGTRRKFYFKDGAMHDSHLYSILVEEWLDVVNSGRLPSGPSGSPGNVELPYTGPSDDPRRQAATADPRPAQDGAKEEAEAAGTKRGRRVAKRAGEIGWATKKETA